MRSLLTMALLATTLLASSLATSLQAAEPQIGHMVFFTLKDNTPETRKTLIDACNKYLSKHEGTVYYSAGARGEEFAREVNDQTFDVALHLVFKDKAAHDLYATHPRHLKFIEECKANWKTVRVFDSLVTPVE
ncbi:Stress responsive alpha-beta barrel domain protein [Pirellula staleyi DSM 6068]|uniref:Stress responsive alpha-beta barrel domain protein n=1 Tax=Pirellula staleyi (strain ATCC 27377 / DSM 6068 / ICPB 4128) TaxID=530564 RepID=D2R4I7_PIRSD|nr:Dabb family protein [Pirellula staleyi]ADB15335.1 Stress responsive alpha-beta barrel domain protein [Pirellula staleyi DSM 6068]